MIKKLFLGMILRYFCFNDGNMYFDPMSPDTQPLLVSGAYG